MDTPSPVTHIGLCAGYGGIELGLHRAVRGMRTVALCEIEAFAISNLVAKMESGLMDPAPIWPDLKTFPWGAFRDRVDILTGGYPCQPFSAAGQRRGKDDPRHLWPYIADGIRLLRPRCCFFENVEGHISLGLSDVIEDLAGMGYRTTWGIFSAAECGAPHQRKRVFILAHNDSERSQELARQVSTQSNTPPSGRLCYWPTVQASEARQGFQNRSRGMKGSQESLSTVVVKHGPPVPASSSTDGSRPGLSQEGRLWMTPKSGACGMTATTSGRPLERATQLTTQVHVVEKQWPTPNSQPAQRKLINGKNQSTKTGQIYGTSIAQSVQHWQTATVSTGAHKQKDGSMTDKLDQQVKQSWPTPASAGVTGGPTGLAGGAGNREKLAKMLPDGEARAMGCGKLNPRWVETLMGLPVGWTMPSCASPVTIERTSCDYSATESCQPQQNGPSEC